MTKKKLFIDHDGTLTYYDKLLGIWKYKDGLSKFLEFANEKFEVYWCSGCKHTEIITELKKAGIEDSTINKINYFQYNPSYVKARSIIEFTKEFIFIDDDGYGDEYKYLKKNKFKDNFIKASPTDKLDLERITKVLNLKIQLSKQEKQCCGFWNRHKE